MKERLAQDISSSLQQYLNTDRDEKYDQSYLGVVEDNMDPLKIGRVKVRLHGLYDDIPTNVLPWVTPNFPLGAGGVKGSFIVPEIGTVINVTFDDGDLYEPKYDSKCLDAVNLNFDADKDEDYPNSVIFYETSKGDYCKINRLRGEYIINTSSGVFFKMCENGDILLSNDASEGGTLFVSLNGNIEITNKNDDYILTTNNKTTSAFGDITTKANGGILEECLDNKEMYANNDIISIAGNDTSIKTKNLLEFGSTSTKVRTNSIEIIPAKESLEDFKFSVCEDIIQIPFMTVKPSSLGGPFNAIMFDTMTGAPHQGRVVKSSGIFASSDTDDIATQKAKITTTVKLKYSKMLARELGSIEAKYTSIDSQTQMLVNSISGNDYLESKKLLEIANMTTTINALRDSELERKLNSISGYLDTSIFATEQTLKDTYTDLIDSATEKAKTDVTGKTTYKDIIGSGDGLVRDINEI